MIRKILIKLFILQVVDNQYRHKNGLKTIGRGGSKAYRINPYNPLSYVTIILAVIVAILMFGVIGAWEEIDLRNPFKYN